MTVYEEKGHSSSDLKTEKANFRTARRHKDNGERALLKKVSDIPKKAIVWLWEFIIAIGKLTIFAGDPGVGKSLATLYIIARLSTGRPIVKNSTEICDCLILSGEDDIADTIRPRLEILGANLDRVHFIKDRIAKDSRHTFSLKDIETIFDSVDQINSKGGNLRLLILDPVDSFLGGTDAYRNNYVREIFEGILKLASEEQFAILGIAHLNKSMTSAAYRVGGSIAFTALSRSVYIFAKDPYNSEKRVMLPLKNNLAKDTNGIQYSIQQAEKNIPFIQFEREIDEKIEDYLLPYIPEKRKNSPEQEEILSLLEKKYPTPMSTHDIAEILKKNDNNISMMLGKLEKKGKIKRPKTGQWLFIKDSADSVNSTNSDQITASSVTENAENIECNEKKENKDE
jgi:RecA-family ATPase